MRIAVAGGSGTVGRHVVDDARRRGHEVVVLTRASGVDLVTGDGLGVALAGCEAVVEAANVVTLRRRVATNFFEATARNLQSACRSEGVGHIVVLSIVGVDRLRSLGYYAAKMTHERLHLAGPVPATVLRSTQFHEFALQVVDRSRIGPVALVPSMLVQTVSARSVAERLVDLAEGRALKGRAPDVTGPPPPVRLEVRSRMALAKVGSRTRVFALPIPGAAGRAIAKGALLGEADAVIAGPSFEAWLDGPDGPR